MKYIKTQEGLFSFLKRKEKYRNTNPLHHPKAGKIKKDVFGLQLLIEPGVDVEKEPLDKILKVIKELSERYFL